MQATSSQATAVSTFTQASFLNLFGILISIIFCLLFLLLGAHTLKYLKEFAVKIKIIVNRADDKNINLKDFNYKHREPVLKNLSYQKWEAIFKNEIKKSRALVFKNIFTSLMAKYDHLLYFPFRDRTKDKYDLLKPKLTFYTLLVITSCCISWMSTIFLTAILQTSFQDTNNISTMLLVGVTVIISIISSLLNLLCINRLFRIYVINVKGAFRVHYGNEYVSAHQGLGEYVPQDTQEHDQIIKGAEELQKQNDFEMSKEEHSMMNLNGDLEKDHREDTLQLGSTRKLLLTGDLTSRDNYRSNPIITIDGFKDVLGPSNHANRGDFDYPIDEQMLKAPNQGLSLISSKRSKTIRDVLSLDVNIEGLDMAQCEDKYVLVEDKHAMGDMELLENEAFKGENKSNITAFTLLFIIISAASVACCYLNYNFPKQLAMDVFFMFLGAIVGDILCFRILLILLISGSHYLKFKRRGYTPLEYKTHGEVKHMLSRALLNMDEQRKQYKERRMGTSVMHSEDFNMLTEKRSPWDKANQSVYYTVNDNEQSHIHFDKQQDSTMKQLYPQDESFINDLTYKKNDDQDRLAVPEKSILKPLNTETHYTQLAFMNNPTLKEPEEELFSDIMFRKVVFNDLVDYNLLLLRKIYDAYEERADKVLQYFRTDKRLVLRKRYMVPILNPNYDYEKLMEEMKVKGMRESGEDEHVYLEGITLCEDSDSQLITCVQMECLDSLNLKRIDRQLIDKFGNTLQDVKQKTTQQPHYGYIINELEETIACDDEQLRKKQLYLQLKAKLQRGEFLTHDELAMLHTLESDRLNDINDEVNELLNKGFQNLTVDEKLQLIELQKEQLLIEQQRLQRQPSLMREDKQRLQQIEEELKRLEYEQLKLKGDLSVEEEERLEELRDEYGNEVFEQLRDKLLAGTLSREELLQLMNMIADLGIQLTGLEQEQLRRMQVKYGLKGQEAVDQEDIETMREKLRKGEDLNKEEVIRMRELLGKYGVTLSEKEEYKLRSLEAHYGLITDKDQENSDKFKELLGKLQSGGFTQEDITELEHLIAILNAKLTPEQQSQLDHFKQLLEEQDQARIQELQQQQELTPEEQIELQQLLQDRTFNDLEQSDQEFINLLHKLEYDTLTKDEVLRLRELQQLLNEDFTKPQELKLQAFELEYGLLSPQQKLFDYLITKLSREELTNEEVLQLRALEAQLNKQLPFELEQKLSQLEVKYGLVGQDKVDERDFKRLRQKLNSGEGLEKGECERLRELLGKHDIKLKAKEEQMLQEMEAQYQQEENLREFGQLLRVLKDTGHIDKVQVMKLRELQSKLGIELPVAEEVVVQALELKYDLKSQQDLDMTDMGRLQDKLGRQDLNLEETSQLRELLNKYNIKMQPLLEDKLLQLELQYGLVTQEELDKNKIAQLRSKLVKGGLTKDEVLELRDMEKQYAVKLSKEEQKKLKELEKKYGLYTEERRNKALIEKLRKKLAPQDLTKEEVLKLRTLEKQYDILLTDPEQIKLRDLELRYGLKTQEQCDEEDIRQLRDKLNLDGDLSLEDLMRLREFEKQYQLGFSEDEKLRLRELEEYYGMKTEEDYDMEEVEELRMKLINDINEEEVRRLVDLVDKYDIKLTEPEFQKLQELKAKYGIREHEENYTNLPQVMVFDEMPKDQKMSLQDALRQSRNQLQVSNTDYLKQIADHTPKGSITSLSQNKNQMPCEELHNQIPFGREDLEQNVANESIYSHQTTIILDEEQVSFKHIENLPNDYNGSENSYSEQDMVYYNKDDMTAYSKNLGLNKVKAKGFRQRVNKFTKSNNSQVNSGGSSQSRNPSSSRFNATTVSKKPLKKPVQKTKSETIEETKEVRQRSKVKPREVKTAMKTQQRYLSDQDQIQPREASRTRQSNNRLQYNLYYPRSAYSQQSSAERQATGQQQDFVTNGVYDNLIEGRIKVDDWNLKYRKKKKKLRRKREGKDWNNRIKELQDIYGIDAQTMIALTQGKGAKQKIADKSKGDFHSQAYQTDMNSMRSTQNTFMNKLSQNHLKQSVNDNVSGMFSMHGGTSLKKWGGDQQSTAEFRRTGLSQQILSRPKGKKGKSKKRNTKKSNANQNAILQLNDSNDSHEESDEAVNDKGFDYNQGSVQEDLDDHIESDDALDQNAPDFTGNDTLFQKRGRNLIKPIKIQNDGDLEAQHTQRSHSKPPLSKKSQSPNKTRNGLSNIKSEQDSAIKNRRLEEIRELRPSSIAKSGHGNRRKRSYDQQHTDDIYIVGPDSQQTMLKNSRLQKSRLSADVHSEEEHDRFLLYQRDDLQDIQEDFINDGRLAKKRRIKRATRSQNHRGGLDYAQRVQQMQQERLQRQRMEQEQALVHGHDKLKKRKHNHDYIKKEINYWLDYDSPYAEYLVARFREWAPANSGVGGPVKRSAPSARFEEIKNAYQPDEERKSLSPERKPPKSGRKQKSGNTAQDIMAMSGMRMTMIDEQENTHEQSMVKRDDTMVIDDFEEP